MRRNLLVAGLFAGALLLAFRATGNAQGQGSASAETRVGLIDLAHVLKNYTKFTRNTEEINAEAKKKEDEVKALQAEVRDLVKQQQELRPESSIYVKVANDATKKRAELEAMAQNAQREIARRQAGVLHQTYQEIEAAVQQYATARGLTLVLRTTRDADVSSANPQDVLQEINRPVVYSAPELDITEAIVQMLNRGSSTTPAASAKPAANTSPVRTATQPQKTGGGTIKR